MDQKTRPNQSTTWVTKIRPTAQIEQCPELGLIVAGLWNAVGSFCTQGFTVVTFEQILMMRYYLLKILFKCLSGCARARVSWKTRTSWQVMKAMSFEREVASTDRCSRMFIGINQLISPIHNWSIWLVFILTYMQCVCVVQWIDGSIVLFPLSANMMTVRFQRNN